MTDDAAAKKEHRKATNALRDQRVQVVYQLLLQGFTSAQILQNIASWGLSPRSNAYYIAAATKRIRAAAAELRASMLEQMLARHADLRVKLYVAQDYATVLAVDKEDAKLLGLYAPEKGVNLQINWESLTDEQLRRVADGEDILKVLGEVKND
jgi:hypothetical protein